MSSIGFSLRRIYTNTRTNLSLSLSRFFVAHDDAAVRLTRELSGTVDQFNIYHGGIIKVQSWNKWRLVRSLFSSKWRGTIEDLEAFPFFPFFERCFVLIVSSASSLICFFQAKRKIIFTRDETNSPFLRVQSFRLEKHFQIRTLKVLFSPFFFLNFQRDRRERERERGEKLFEGCRGILRVRWTISDSQLGAIQSGDILMRL